MRPLGTGMFKTKSVGILSNLTQCNQRFNGLVKHRSFACHTTFAKKWFTFFSYCAKRLT